jgi:cellulose synthase/poly-beta-1,6-N-acetylglucosamine synthase-like glycosyltransferase
MPNEGDYGALMHPKVSIIMPVRNGQKYIGEAIESIAAQTYRDFELIVVNDGSTDGTCDQLQRFTSRIDLQCIHHPTTQGIARSVNDGIRNARGRFIAFLDHDDLWFPEFLETQMAHLDRNPDVGMVHSDFQTIDAAGNVLEASVAKCRKRTRVSGYVFRALFMDSFIVGNSVLIRKDCFNRLGVFDEALRIGDYHMWLRIARFYKVNYTPEVLTKYRQHQTQDSRKFSAELVPPGLSALQSILELYPEVWSEIGKGAVHRRMASLYLDMAYPPFTAGLGRIARAFLRKALCFQPFSPRVYAFYAATFLGPSQALTIKRIWHKLAGLPTPSRTSISHV